MKFDRAVIEYRLGIATLWLAAVLMVGFLGLIHFAAISFLVPSWYDMHIADRIFAFMLIVPFALAADYFGYRYVKGRMDDSRWTAEIKREHESRNG